MWILPRCTQDAILYLQGVNRRVLWGLSMEAGRGGTLCKRALCLWESYV